jgi:hypothetical protein
MLTGIVGLPVIASMAGDSEEVTMLHYLLYKALAEERTRNLVAVARRHQLVAEAIHESREAKSPVARLRDVTARMVALLNGRRGARPDANVTSSRGAAGPIGCAT